MKVVSNTTPLIGLASIGRFDLLRQLFGELIIPQAVFDETVVVGKKEGGAKREVSSAGWVKVVSIKDQLAVEVLLDELDRGEAEVIVLARELDAGWVLMDENKRETQTYSVGNEKDRYYRYFAQSQGNRTYRICGKRVNLVAREGF